MSIEGRWRMQLDSPGGPLPFFVQVLPEGSSPAAYIENGAWKDPISIVWQSGSLISLQFEVYDARIEATLSSDSKAMVGQWSKTTPGGTSSLAMSATRIPPSETQSRFLPAAIGNSTSIAGQWKTVFLDEDGESMALGEFEQQGERVTGTFLTATGDYRFLDGDFDGTSLRLSTFDGAHAFLFTAKLINNTLSGHFWSRDSYHATFSATRHTGSQGAILPDPYTQVAVTSNDKKMRFAFPNIAGEIITNEDPQFHGKVVIIDIFGTWCPNCNDIAPILVDWYSRFHDKGLEVVALAYEFSGDQVRDRDVLTKFRDQYGIEFPILLAGVSDKAAAAKTLPDLSDVKSYPTTIFVGRDGKVRKIHSGFAGPGTGEHHRQLIAEMEQILSTLLAE